MSPMPHALAGVNWICPKTRFFSFLFVCVCFYDMDLKFPSNVAYGWLVLQNLVGVGLKILRKILSN